MKNSRKGKRDADISYKTEEQLKQEAIESIRLREDTSKQGKPKTAVAKNIENFWYHYKGVTIGTAIVLVLAVMFLRDTVFRPKPDLTIIMISSKYAGEEYLGGLTQRIEAVTPDFNGDGKIIVSLDFSYFVPEDLLKQLESTGEPVGSQDNYTVMMKIMAVMSTGSDSVYLLDKENYEYLSSIPESEGASGDYRIFKSLDDIPAANGDEIPMKGTILEAGEIAPYYDEMGFYYRELETTKRNETAFKNGMEFLKGIAKPV